MLPIFTTLFFQSGTGAQMKNFNVLYIETPTSFFNQRYEDYELLELYINAIREINIDSKIYLKELKKINDKVYDYIKGR
jgi:hypothetical protein